MNSTELKTKLDAANDKVEKRLNTLKKLCRTLNVNSDFLLNDFNSIDLNRDYLPHKDAFAIVSKYVTEKDTSGLSHEEYWEVCEFNDKIEALTDNLCKLFDVKKIAKNWEIKYDASTNKENATKIPAIWDFLTNWATKAEEWYLKDAEYYVKKLNEFHNIANTYIDNNFSDAEISYNNRYSIIDEYNNYMKENHSKEFIFPRHMYKSHYSATECVTCESLTARYLSERFHNTENEDSVDYMLRQTFGYEALNGYYDYSFDTDGLHKVIEEEKLRKYFDLCNRISAYVGEITDASCLTIGDKSGEINGVVIGTKGKARVETISAGGWNIQCFHYRILIHSIKD